MYLKRGPLVTQKTASTYQGIILYVGQEEVGLEEELLCWWYWFYVRNDLNVEGIPVSVFIELYQFGMIIGCIYKPPNYVGDFVVALEKLLDTLEKQKTVSRRL